jgi:hypothetical protein
VPSGTGFFEPYIALVTIIYGARAGGGKGEAAEAVEFEEATKEAQRP